MEPRPYRRVELSAGEELEPGAEGAVVNEDPDELLHHRFRVFHELGQAAADLPQGRQGKFGPDGRPYLIADRLALGVHRCLIAISDGLQEPLAGERITAQRKRTQR